MAGEGKKDSPHNPSHFCVVHRLQERTSSEYSVKGLFRVFGFDDTHACTQQKLTLSEQYGGRDSKQHWGFIHDDDQ